MEDNKTELKLIQMSEVEAEEVSWLWYPFIPYGKLTIIQGDPGDGKTTLVLNLAARLSKGLALDEQENGTDPISVIYQTAEDGLADTVKLRLEEAGADCSRISVIDESDKSLSMADERIEGEPNLRAMVQIKNNLAAFGNSKAFELSESGFRWIGDYEITADEVLGGIAPKVNKQDRATDLLKELMNDRKMIPSNEIFEIAREENISKRTLENAKQSLGIKAKKINDTWYWILKEDTE